MLRCTKLTKIGNVFSVGNMHRYLGLMMYGSEELLLAWNIACKDEEEAHVAEEEDA